MLYSSAVYLRQPHWKQVKDGNVGDRSIESYGVVRDYPFSTCAKLSKKLTFLIS